MEVSEFLWFCLALTTTLMFFKAFERYLLLRAMETIFQNVDQLAKVVETVLSPKVHHRCVKEKSENWRRAAFAPPGLS
tara:strand:- start:595 stop:828 length:234 start_codon:yes stop_codon:yes gene_type:complete